MRVFAIGWLLILSSAVAFLAFVKSNGGKNEPMFFYTSAQHHASALPDGINWDMYLEVMIPLTLLSVGMGMIAWVMSSSSHSKDVETFFKEADRKFFGK